VYLPFSRPGVTPTAACHAPGGSLVPLTAYRADRSQH
jgi:hypothetical protein